MLRRATILLAALLATPALPDQAAAQFAAYPGSVRDAALEAKAAEQAQRAGMGAATTSTIATSADSFEKVTAFYRSRGKEVMLPKPPGQPAAGYERELPGGFRRGPNGLEVIPSGIKVKQVIFILDGAADINASKDWISALRPLVGDMMQRDGLMTYTDVRDVTAIVRAQKQ